MSILTGEVWSHGGAEGNLAEAVEDLSFFKEHSGEPALLRVSKGFWSVAPRFMGDGGTHTAVSVERTYSLGFLAGADSIDEQKESSRTIPVQNFLEWQTEWHYTDPTAAAHGPRDLDIGMEWIIAVPKLGTGNSVPIPPIDSPKNPQDVYVIGKRIPVEDHVLPAIGQSTHYGDKERFMVVEGAIGAKVLGMVVSIAEREDVLLQKILTGDVQALHDATKMKIKLPASASAVERVEKINQQDYDNAIEAAAQLGADC